MPSTHRGPNYTTPTPPPTSHAKRANTLEPRTRQHGGGDEQKASDDSRNAQKEADDQQAHARPLAPNQPQALHAHQESSQEGRAHHTNAPRAERAPSTSRAPPTNSPSRTGMPTNYTTARGARPPASARPDPVTSSDGPTPRQGRAEGAKRRSQGSARRPSRPEIGPCYLTTTTQKARSAATHLPHDQSEGMLPT